MVEFVFSDIPVTQIDAVTKRAALNSIDTTKAVIRKYIESFFSKLNKDGQESSLYANILQIVDPSTINFEVAGEEVPIDPTKKGLWIRSLYSDLEAKFPAYIVGASNIIPVPLGLSAVPRAIRHPNDPKKSLLLIENSFDISMTIFVVADDEGTSNRLFDVLQIIFSEMRKLTPAKGLLATDEGSLVNTTGNWSVTLPIYTTATATRAEARPDSNKDQIYIAELNLEHVRFQGWVFLEADYSTNWIFNPNIQSTVNLPDTLTVGSVYEFNFIREVDIIRMTSSDRKIATVTDDGVIRIYARRPGTFIFRIQQVLDQNVNILYEKEIRVI